MSVALHHAIAGPGDGRVVLLGSSLGTNREVWDPQVPALAERLRVVRFDHRGAACCGAIERMDLRGDLPRITAPTLVISGAEDAASAPEHQQLIADAIPGAGLELVADAAHLASVQQPQIVNRLIVEHLHANERRDARAS